MARCRRSPVRVAGVRAEQSPQSVRPSEEHGYPLRARASAGANPQRTAPNRNRLCASGCGAVIQGEPAGRRGAAVRGAVDEHQPPRGGQRLADPHPCGCPRREGAAVAVPSLTLLRQPPGTRKGGGAYRRRLSPSVRAAAPGSHYIDGLSSASWSTVPVNVLRTSCTVQGGPEGPLAPPTRRPGRRARSGRPNHAGQLARRDQLGGSPTPGEVTGAATIDTGTPRGGSHRANAPARCPRVRGRWRAARQRDCGPG
jgi:hypothetical protein